MSINLKLKKMKKIILVLGIVMLSLTSCSDNMKIVYVEVPAEIEELKNINCWNIISTANFNFTCEDRSIHSIKVVSHSDYISGDWRVYSGRTIEICLINEDYKQSDFKLGQLICDLSIYK